jgi:hypothetical protein
MQRLWNDKPLCIKMQTTANGMKTTLLVLWATGLAFGQSSIQPVRRDSVPDVSRATMPTLRPGNDFYRNPNDPPNVVRATLDNMPVMGVDPSTQHTMLQATPPRAKNRQLPQIVIPNLPPLGPVLPAPKKR